MTANGSITAKYIRGLNLIASMDANGANVRHYLYNAHGDTTQLTDSAGNVIINYDYDAFGNEKNPNASDTNPFRYCGEYYDKETGTYYLRARYYDPSAGRFISEDPAKNGLNWYTYCSNNPVNKIDPLGLFDYNTRLSYNQTYNVDVEVLQQELVNRGYLDMSGGGWGYFGSKTQAAVNRYKTDMGLGNAGKDRGVVGAQTWSSLGLIMRQQKDIDAGVEIATIDRKQYFDVSVPINNALNRNKGIFENNKNMKDKDKWFKSMVGSGRAWDIKVKEKWEETIGSTFPGAYNTKVILFGSFTTPETLGNITYGYLGTAAGYNETWLLWGGDYAAAGNSYWGIITSADSPEDKAAIRQGIQWYNNR